MRMRRLNFYGLQEAVKSVMQYNKKIFICIEQALKSMSCLADS